MMRDDQLTLTPNFSAPFAETVNPDAESLNPRLVESLLAAERDEHAPENPVPTLKVNVFESEFNILQWPDPAIQSLKRFLLSSVVRLVKELNGYDEGQMQALTVSNHTWFHITRNGGYASTHNHPMASWSSVYCVDPGDAPADDADSGVLRFHDPRAPAGMYLDPANSHLQRPYNYGSVNYRLRPGQLVIFPSWVTHEVTPYTGQRPRITIASNYWFRER